MKTSHLRSLFVLIALLTGVVSIANQGDITQPDNSAVNSRDQNSDAKTASRQANGSKRDIEITRMIRRALTKDSDLSTYGKNIKIVTLDGMVTLRGPVHTDAEKMKIGNIAQRVVRQDKIQNEIEVKQ